MAPMQKTTRLTIGMLARRRGPSGPRDSASRGAGRAGRTARRCVDGGGVAQQVAEAAEELEDGDGALAEGGEGCGDGVGRLIGNRPGDGRGRSWGRDWIAHMPRRPATGFSLDSASSRPWRWTKMESRRAISRRPGRGAAGRSARFCRRSSGFSAGPRRGRRWRCWSM